MTEDTPRPSLQPASASITPSAVDLSTGSSKTNSHHFVEVLVNDPQWRADLSFDVRSVIEKCFDVTLQEIVAPKAIFELSVLLTNDAEIQALNKEYRQKDKPTNVLSFESGVPFQSLALEKTNQAIPLGDIALSYGRLVLESEAQEKAFQDHFTHLVIHGILHLLGFDHEDDDEADAMESLEMKLLKQHFDINNPYEDKV